MAMLKTPQQKPVSLATPPSLAIYIHWPFCKSKCPYCDFNSHVREQIDQEAWKSALRRELKHMSEWTPGRTVTSIFFGGGTPSLMPPETVTALLEDIRSLWKQDTNIEITLEANPTSVEASRFKAFRDAGVNRVSLGVQSLIPEELNFLGRQHSTSEAIDAVKLAADIFPRYTFDLIYARPRQTTATWEKELREAMKYAGDHLSVYQLTIEENTAFHHQYEQKKFALPEDDSAAEMYQLTQDILSAHNMPAYEISNHARAGEESRHNLAYWQYDDYLGIGPGAHGRVIVDGTRYATETLKSPERWLESVQKQCHGLSKNEALSSEQQSEECLMMGLRLNKGINAKDFEIRTGNKLLDVINPKEFAKLEAQGLIEWNAPILRTTPRGQMLLNTIIGKLLT